MIFLTGGARSGKSTLAVRMAGRHSGKVWYIATARPDDEEMKHRIEAHRLNRPDEWTVVEEPTDLSRAVRESGADELIVIDCVTLWISNLMVDHDDAAILEKVDEVVADASGRDPAALVVSNEVGTGLVPMDPVGRRFRDLQGAANQRFASAAEEAYLVVAGKTLRLDDPNAG